MSTTKKKLAEFSALEKLARRTRAAIHAGSCGGSSLDVYSTEETRIGTWIDGKPLYRIVIGFTMPSTSGDWMNIADLPPNVDKVVKISGVVYGANGYTASLPQSSAVLSSNVGILAQNTKIQASCKNPSFSGRNSYAFVEYTKTTDQATITPASDQLFSISPLDAVQAIPVTASIQTDDIETAKE